jgi:hydroxyacylglutathione hydrolase
MNIYQFRYADDNLAYLVAADRTAMAIDGGAVADILAAVDRLGLALRYVVNTHDHPDHTVGSRQLAERADADLLDHRQLLEMGSLALDAESVEVMATPGHTRDSKTFVCGGDLITGDTLFNGTVGNCFSGDLDAFFDAVSRLMAFPDTARVYAGHDYVRYAVAFARTLPVDSAALDAYLDAYDPLRVVTTLGQERRVNPYLMFNDPVMVAHMRASGLPVATELERWKSLMTLG